MKEDPTKSKLADFSYEAINRHVDSRVRGILQSNEYMALKLPENNKFIAFMRKEEPKGECDEGKIFKEYGLKFHISLPEYDKGMYNKAMDIAINTLMLNQVSSFKVIRSQFNMSDQAGQEGKDVTIYVEEAGRTLEQWQKVLTDVTKSLVDNGIKPGYRAPGTAEKPEKPVQGSNYITYRYYNEQSKTQLWPNPDPVENIKVILEKTTARNTTIK